MKVKTQKGITLIALIITIIVLMILAVVAINSVKETGIINYAQNAVDEYSAGQTKENEAIAGYMEYLNKYGNQKKDDKPVSIAGKYGYYTEDANNQDANYYIFNEGTMKDGVESGTGVYVCWEDSPTRREESEFNYQVLKDKTVVITGDLDNEDQIWKFEVEKDNNGNVINRVIYVNEYSTEFDDSQSPYNGEKIYFFEGIMTTDGVAGLEKIDLKEYTPVVNADDRLKSVEFKDGKMYVTWNNDTFSIDNYFVIDMKNVGVEERKIVYANTWDDVVPDNYNLYMPLFVIWSENEIENLD